MWVWWIPLSFLATFGGIFLGFLHTASCHLRRLKVWFFLCLFGWLLFIFVVWLLRLVLPVQHWKKKNGENGHSCYVSDFWGKSVSFFLIGKDFHSQHFVCDIYDIEVFSLYPYTRRDIFKKGCCVLSGRFSAFIERIICFLFFLILMWFITLMGLQILNHSWKPGIDASLSCWILLLMYCWILLASIFLRIFTSIFIMDIGL